MRSQVNISFKAKSEKEQELYKWISEKLQPSAFIKEVLYQVYANGSYHEEQTEKSIPGEPKKEMTFDLSQNISDLPGLEGI